MEEPNATIVGEYYYLLINYGFTNNIYHCFTITRKKYKRTSRNTTTLYNHLKSKHVNKFKTETENTGRMNKFVTRDIYTCKYLFPFFSLIFFIF